MKNYYIEISISYHGNSEEEFYVGVENYQMVLQEKSKKIAKDKAKIEAKKIFDDEINEGFLNINIKIEQCYKTSDKYFLAVVIVIPLNTSAV